MRSNGGPCRPLIDCRDYKCTHHVAIDADRWGDDVCLSDLEPQFICKTDIRPLLGQARMGTG